MQKSILKIDGRSSYSKIPTRYLAKNYTTIFQMSRIKEKVKDLIEVHEYESLVDFQSEPSKTLSGYHFTDVTSELMAQWLDAVNDVGANGGKAKALAGYRGVGKSHFLATFAAIIAHPELRSRINDSHVTASAQVLMRRPYPVANARRGTEGSLLEEVKIGIAETLGTQTSELPEKIGGLVDFIVENNNDVPFVIIIDTAFERDSRVSRDDGLFLGELAEHCKDKNIFIGVALDDDITDADGINLAISRTYTIDYLDQEHLNKIVHKHIFSKHRQSQTHIHDIYQYFRANIPGFRWSEQTFGALYPLHPSILELAQFIRLYAPHFALLGFASEAGARILGRPANSLIALDEVFDNVEATLRKAEDLTEIFEVYDKISTEVISQIPVMQRLQAKLILKALFILSLDGDATTAKEIAATMLIYDENDPQKAIDNVEVLLDKITDAFPDDLVRKVADGKETRFSLKVSSKDLLNEALDDAIQAVSDDVIPKILRRVANDKFSDWNLSGEDEDDVNIWTDCQVNWRGGQRRCRLYWNWDEEVSKNMQTSDNMDYLDLEIFINNPNNENVEETHNFDALRAVWQPAELTKNDRETILRFHVLLNDETLRNEFGEQIRAAGHKHILEIEKIWNRIFIGQANIIHDSDKYSLDDTDLSKQTLGELLSPSLESIFENIYPEHPTFEQTLGMVEVSKLVNDLFSGARKTHEGVQLLAETFALPLGIVSKRGEEYSLEKEETLFRLPLVEKVLSLVNQNENATISLKEIYHALREKPYGLIREAQHLILAALVAQRKIEFITTTGDRINRRSLDLNIIWDDIAGVAKPASVVYETKRLTEWARNLTGLSEIGSIDSLEDRDKVKKSLQNWFDNWEESRLLERFNELPDESLNTKIWYKTVQIEKSFGSVATTLQNYFEEVISLEMCLQRIGDSFSDSNKEFKNCKDDVKTLECFVENAADRQEIWRYLAICERTETPEIEILREKLFALLDMSADSPNSKSNAELRTTWDKFLDLYSQNFASKHDAVMRSHDLQEKFDIIIKSDAWWEFKNLTQLPIFHQKHWKEAKRLYQKFQELDCKYNLPEMLKSHPSCGCSFNLTQVKDWTDLPKAFVKTIENGRQSYKKTLIKLSESLVQMLETFIKNETDEESIESANDLIEQFAKTKKIKTFTTSQLIILQKIFSTMASTPTIAVEYPQSGALMNSEEMRQDLDKWLDELPSESVLLKLQ